MFKSILSYVAILLVSSGAYASEITFEDRPAGPGTFGAAGPAQTLVYNVGGVTTVFAGGVILTNEVSQNTDFSNIYATASFADSTLSNPLVVTFSQPIHNFQIDILNAISGEYTLSDNAGNSTTFLLATNGSSLATEGFAAAGTQVMINSIDGKFFDFAIDNVTFNQPLGPTTATPELSSIYMLGTGALTICCGLRRKVHPR